MKVYPNLPDEFVDHWLNTVELTNLWNDLIIELLDQQFSGRTHHNSRTYDAGCKGPLCLKSVRVRARRRNQAAPNERYLYVDQILDYWWPFAEQRIADLRARLVEELTG